MAMPAGQWTHIIITPCYVIYKSNKHSTFAMLRALFDEYLENYNTGCDTETCVQGWQGLIAIVRLLKERKEWDRKRKQPIQRQTKLPLWKERHLKIGTEEWKEHWTLHPEEQGSMSKHVMRKLSKEGSVLG